MVRRVVELVWTQMHVAVRAYVDVSHRMPEGRMPEGRMPEGESGVNHPWMAEREHDGTPRPLAFFACLLSFCACLFLRSKHEKKASGRGVRGTGVRHTITLRFEGAPILVGTPPHRLPPPRRIWPSDQ